MNDYKRRLERFRNRATRRPALHEKTVTELRTIARGKGLAGYSNLNKEQLLQLLGG